MEMSFERPALHILTQLASTEMCELFFSRHFISLEYECKGETGPVFTESYSEDVTS